jgi:CRP-like cAMP-binding protein
MAAVGALFVRHRPGSRPAALRALPMFGPLSDKALQRVDGQLAEVEVPAGTVLVRQHDIGREALIVADGRAAICVNGEIVASVGPGELIGEIALLDNGLRTATVTALTAMRIYVLDPRQFCALFDEPETGRWIAANLAARLRLWQAAAR